MADRAKRSPDATDAETQVGAPVALGSSGFASANLGPLASGSTVTATYSGDSLYNGSVSAAATTSPRLRASPGAAVREIPRTPTL